MLENNRADFQKRYTHCYLSLNYSKVTPNNTNDNNLIAPVKLILQNQEHKHKLEAGSVRLPNDPAEFSSRIFRFVTS
jgi:hypothetical protein